jgi:hypothetical protein
MMRGSPEIAATVALLSWIVAALAAAVLRVGRRGLRAGGGPASPCAIGAGPWVFRMFPGGAVPAPGGPGDAAGDRPAPAGGSGGATRAARPPSTASGPPGPRPHPRARR